MDPAVVPEVEESPELMITALVKRGGRWLMPEYCESMMKKEELDEQFFSDRNLQLLLEKGRGDLSDPVD